MKQYRHVYVIEQRFKGQWFAWCPYIYREEARDGLASAKEANPQQKNDFRIAKYAATHSPSRRSST